MGRIKLKQWLKKENVWLFGATDATQRPGYLYRRVRQAFGPSKFEPTDPAWMWLDRLKEEFPVVEARASIVQGTWSRTFDGMAGVQLKKKFGLDIGLKRDFAGTVTLSATGMTVKVLDDELFGPDKLATELGKHIKRRDIYLAFRTYYATSMELEFHSDDGVGVGVDLVEIPVNVGLETSWTEDGKLTISQDPTIPFGFWGPRIKPERH